MFTFIISKIQISKVHIYNGIESGKEEEWLFVSTLILLAQTKGPWKNK
jgi:hypothetical protein